MQPATTKILSPGVSDAGGMGPTRLPSALRQLPAYRSLIWVSRLTGVGVLAFLGSVWADQTWIVLAVAGVMASSLVLLSLMLTTVVFSQAAALPNDRSFRFGELASQLWHTAGRDIFTGIPRTGPM